MSDNGTGRPRLYIGSSQAGRAIADALRLNLQTEIKAEIWSHGIVGAAAATLDLVAGDFDFAAIVITPIDVAMSRHDDVTPREDILVEAGLFLGRLGRQRTFLVQPRDLPIPLPSVLTELNTIGYRTDAGPTLETALAPAAARLRAAIRKFKEYRPVLRPGDLERSETESELLASPRRSDTVGTAWTRGPQHGMRIVNLSVTGALLESSGVLPIGQILDLDLAVSGGPPIGVTAKVVRVQQPDWGRVGGVGVAFTAMAPDSRAALQRFVEGDRRAA